MELDRQPTLIGERVMCRPLQKADWEVMFAAASDPLIWELHPARNRYTEEAFRAYFQERLASEGTLVILDRASGHVLGWSSYGSYDAPQDEVEIGWTFLIRAEWGGDTNRDVKGLMLRHAFATVKTVSFRIAETNLRSRRATEKIGAKLTDRAESIAINGITVSHCVYTITSEQLATANASP